MKNEITKLVQKYPVLQNKEIIIDLIKTSQSLNDKLFTEIDMIEFGKTIAWNMVGKTITQSFIEELSTKLVKSLQQTSWDVEVNDLNQITKIL